MELVTVRRIVTIQSEIELKRGHILAVSEQEVVAGGIILSLVIVPRTFILVGLVVISTFGSAVRFGKGTAAVERKL